MENLSSLSSLGLQYTSYVRSQPHLNEKTVKEESLDVRALQSIQVQNDQGVSVSLSTRYEVRASKAELYQDVAGNQNANPYANTILNAIANQLAVDAADGASQEELQSRFEAGLEGFIKGFNEAKEQLDAIGALDASVGEAIGDTHSKVLSGLQELAQKYGLSSESLEEHRKGRGENEIETSAPQGSFSGAFDSFSQSLTQLREFSFSLRTRDGDTVEIQVAAGQRTQAAISQGDTGSAVQASNATQNGFAFSVDGELDADEMGAINDLLNQIGHISDEFFNGDVYQAFDMALELGYNTEEIAGFALHLSKTEIQEASSTYARPLPAPDASGNPSSVGRLAPLANMVDLLEQAKETTSKFGRDLSLIEDLAEQFGRSQYADHAHSDKLKPFLHRLLQA